MAMWVDAYDSNCSEDTLIEYLYHLVWVNAQKRDYFKDLDVCDDFALYCVTKLYPKYKNKQERTIKSIVNYIKTVIDPWRADYVKDFCGGSAKLEIASFDVHDFGDYLIDVVSEHDYNNFYHYDVLRISDVIYKYLKQIPRKKNSAEWSNICVSCLLTIQDRLNIALNLCSKEMIDEHPQLFNRVIRDLKNRPAVLYHLDESMSAYVSVLVNQLIHAIAAELTAATGTTIAASVCLKNMVIAAANESEDE